MSEPTPKKSDLGVRTLSAIVMLAVAGGALWLGGWFWASLVVLVALGVFVEWIGLVRRFATTGGQQAAWYIVGIAYLGVAALCLAALAFDGLAWLLLTLMIALVIATDIGAYFAGRTFGGPKIAPTISPSKTWAGLAGGILASAGVTWAASAYMFHFQPAAYGIAVAIAVVAQAGDFFESWMKRRAGEKDSGNLIPGHGGMFDRVDGLIAVSFVAGLFGLASWGFRA